MAELILLAMIGAKIGMGTWYWVIYGIYAFCWLLCRFMKD